MRRVKDNEFPQNGFEAWGGYMQAKMLKLEEQFCVKANCDNQQLSNIFNGISIYVNGYTNPSADELKTLMSNHGGVYHTYQRSNDFIIASNLPDTKVKKMSLVRVVKPEWITESIAANCLLDYKEYLLYNRSRTQPKLQFESTIKIETLNSINETCIENCAKEEIKSPTLKVQEMLVTSTSTENSVNSILSDKLHVTGNYKQANTVTRTAADPNFILDFYNNSRLHHISQLGTCFKQHINELRDTSNFQFPARKHLQENITKLSNNKQTELIFEGGKIIMHIDMDCFFVSVGLRNRPELRGKPIAVTHARTGQPKPVKRPGVDRVTEFNLYRQRNAQAISKAIGASEEILLEQEIETKVDNITDENDKFGSMSEIASCSYEARAKGVNNGMFMGAALRLCPDIVPIPYDFEGYKEVAYTLYNTIAQYTLDIEAVSCDEMYVDCTELIKSINVSVEDFATALRDEIRIKTGCPCSTGFGGNKLQARLATKQAKPDGQYFLTVDMVEDFIMNIKLRDLPGVGRQTSHRLEALGHQTCGSLQSLSLSTLQHHLGNKTGAQLYDQCRGRDTSVLHFYSVRKSVSAEVNYGIRFENNEQCTQFLTQLSAEVHRRMQEFKVSGKCITLKLMVRAEGAPVETAKFMGHGFCNVINKSVTLPNSTNDLQVITREVLSICKKQNVDPKEMRGIGIQITKLETAAIKTKTGAMSKFLSVKTNQTYTTENKPVVDNSSNNQVLHDEKKSNVFNMNSKVNTTPKKHTTISPSKKKSPILSTRSPVKRKKKNLYNKLTYTTSKNVMSKFLQGKAQSDLQTTSIEKEFKKDIPEKAAETNENNGILNLPWETVRDMLRAWVDQKSPPLQYDIILLSSYMTDMVIQKNIDKVKILMNFLRRKTREINSRDWYDVYHHIEDDIQNTMIAVYGKRLLLFDD